MGLQLQRAPQVEGRASIDLFDASNLPQCEKIQQGGHIQRRAPGQ